LVYSLYESHCGILGEDTLKRGKIRTCPDCGAELKPRRRYCDDCARKRRLDSYRRRRRK
jgi:uncharacterized OB-fold protein